MTNGDQADPVSAARARMTQLRNAAQTNMQNFRKDINAVRSKGFMSGQRPIMSMFQRNRTFQGNNNGQPTIVQTFQSRVQELRKNAQARISGGQTMQAEKPFVARSVALGGSGGHGGGGGGGGGGLGTMQGGGKAPVKKSATLS